jgi:hypothetical protein
VVARLGVVVAAWLAALPWAPLHAAAADLLLYRSVFPAQRTAAPERMTAGPDTILAGTPLLAPQPARLRIASPDPTLSAALRLAPDPADPAAWILTVVLVPAGGSRTYQYLTRGVRLVNGAPETQPGYRADGLETDLAGAEVGGTPRRVSRLVVQDDGGMEVRLRLEGETLLLTAIPPALGGEPAVDRYPGGQGPPLRFLDYHLLLGGFAADSFSIGGTYNAFAEVYALGFLSARVNVLSTKTARLTLARLEVAQQAWRSERLSFWLDGGLRAFQEQDPRASAGAPTTASWTFGTALHWRSGDWGAALRLAAADGPAVAEVQGGWQTWRHVGFFAFWQSVGALSDLGLGVAAGF